MKEKYRRPQISTVGLVAHYKLWAGLTTTGEVFDYSLNGNNGTVTNALPASPGFSFNGVGDDIDAGNIGAVKTCTFWMKPDGATQEIMQFASGEWIDMAGGTIAGNGAGVLLTFFVNGVASTFITNAVWNFVACTEAGLTADTVLLGEAFGIGNYTGFFGETMFFDRTLSAPDIKSIYELTKWRYQ